MKFFLTLLFSPLTFHVFAQLEKTTSIEEEANEAIFLAEFYFRSDSFELALNGRSSSFTRTAVGLTTFLGFKDIINKYKGTKAANLARYYIGVSFLNLGEYEKAITYLSNFDTEDLIIQTSIYGLIGDAYSEQADFKMALKYYNKAFNSSVDESYRSFFLYKIALLTEVKYKNVTKAIAKNTLPQQEEKPTKRTVMLLNKNAFPFSLLSIRK